MMGEQNPAAAVLLRTLRKELVARSSRRDFDRHLLLFRPSLDVKARDFIREIMLLRELPHEGRVVDREESAQLVIEVTEHQLVRTRVEQGVQKRDRIPPS